MSENYPESAFSVIFNLEKKHFWFIGRKKIITDFIKNNICSTDKSFLDIGCGTGDILSGIELLGLDVYGIDINSEGIKFAKKVTHASLTIGQIGKTKFKSKFDAVGLFDVLEHIDNEDNFLKECKFNLRKGGKLFITVPAYEFLWTDFDKMSGHKRRYSKKQLELVLQKNDFKIKKISYFGFFHFIPQVLFRFINRNKEYKTSEKKYIQKAFNVPMTPVNYIFKKLLIFESKIINISSFPFGGSVIVCAVKIK